MRRFAVFAAIFLLLPVAVGEGDPNPKDTPVELDDTVRAIALGGDSGVIGAGIDDPTARNLIDPTAVSADVWFFLNHLDSQMHAGSADRDACGEVNLDDCRTDVVDVAVSSDGKLLIVAGQDGDSYGTLTFVDSFAGEKQSITFGDLDPLDSQPRVLKAMAASYDGKHIVVALHDAGPVGNGQTDLHKFTWDSVAEEAAEDWTLTVAGEPLDVSIGDNGRRVVVGTTNGHVRVFDGVGTVTGGIDGEVLDVDLSADTSKYWSVASFDGGEVALYSTASETGAKTAVFSQRPVNNEAQTAVAIANHGKWFAAGSATGDVRLWVNPFIVDTVVPLVAMHADLDGSVSQMKFSEDGRYLVVAAGDGVYLYRTTEDRFTLVWTDVHDDGTGIGGVDISPDSSLVIAAAGAHIIRYQELRGFEITLPENTVRTSPGNQVAAQLVYENVGNRDATVAFTATAPANWQVSFDDPAMEIGAGAEEPFRINLKPPTTAAAGDVEVVIHYEVNGEDVGSTILPVQVLQKQSWEVTRLSTEVQSMDPGARVAFEVNVTNRGNALDSTQVLVDSSDEDWLVEVVPADLELSPGAFKKVIMYVTAPVDAIELDTTHLVVTLSSDASATTTFDAVVGADFGMTFSIATPDSLKLIPGNRTTVELKLVNVGNAVDSFRIESAGIPAGWIVRFPDDQNPHTVFSLAPAESWTIPVDLTTLATSAPGNYQVAFRATSLGDTSVSLVAKQVLVVDELPEEKPAKKEKKSPGVGFIGVVGLLGAAAVSARKR